jgi:hypothetical protein
MFYRLLTSVLPSSFATQNEYHHVHPNPEEALGFGVYKKLPNVPLHPKQLATTMMEPTKASVLSLRGVSRDYSNVLPIAHLGTSIVLCDTECLRVRCLQETSQRTPASQTASDHNDGTNKTPITMVHPSLVPLHHVAHGIGPILSRKHPAGET